eukprot:scaffold63107_cov36-Phaeocystis_antarctica.AAC.1
MGLGGGWTVCAPLICGAGVAWVSSLYNHAPVLFLRRAAAHPRTPHTQSPARPLRKLADRICTIFSLGAGRGLGPGIGGGGAGKSKNGARDVLSIYLSLYLSIYLYLWGLLYQRLKLIQTPTPIAATLKRPLVPERVGRVRRAPCPPGFGIHQPDPWARAGP